MIVKEEMEDDKVDEVIRWEKVFSDIKEKAKSFKFGTDIDSLRRLQDNLLDFDQVIVEMEPKGDYFFRAMSVVTLSCEDLHPRSR